MGSLAIERSFNHISSGMHGIDIIRPAINVRHDNPLGCGVFDLKGSAKKMTAVIEQKISSSEQLRLTFNAKDGITIEGNNNSETYPIGRFIARAFENVYFWEKEKVSSITLESGKLCSNGGWIKTVRDMFELAQQEKVNELNAFLQAVNLTGLKIDRSGFAADKPYPLLPGEYKHYMSTRRTNRLHDLGFLQGAKKRSDYVISLTKLSLSKEEAPYVLYSEEERQVNPDFASHVISFNFKPGVNRNIKFKGSDPSLDGDLMGNLFLDEIDVQYWGENNPARFFDPAGIYCS